MIGPLARDVVDGGAASPSSSAGRGQLGCSRFQPRIGGGPWYAARALRALRQEAMVVAKCGEPERHSYRRHLAALGLPISLAVAGETTAFSFRYDADGSREMSVDAVGEPWEEGDEPERALRRVEWVHVAPLLRDDFPVETLERIGRRRRLLFDGHGLVRARRLGPLVLDSDFDRTLLRHVSILKLAEEEAHTILGHDDLEELRELGVPEVVVTFGARGSLVLTRDTAVRISAPAVRGDPTGAGDAFSVAYLSARAGGHSPTSAARRASALVSALLEATAR